MGLAFVNLASNASQNLTKNYTSIFSSKNKANHPKDSASNLIVSDDEDLSA